MLGYIRKMTIIDNEIILYGDVYIMKDTSVLTPDFILVQYPIALTLTFVYFLDTLKYWAIFIFYFFTIVTDIDECSTGTASCAPNSQCINLPGTYYCQCKPGYHSTTPDNQLGTLCTGQLPNNLKSVYAYVMVMVTESETVCANGP